jgi:hypothetical protein
MNMSSLKSNGFSKLNANRVFVIGWAILSAVIVYAQSWRWVPLGDYSYMVEYAYKIHSGSIPFRDFMTPYPPGTFFIMSWLMKIFGTSNLLFKIYVALLQALIVVISYMVLKRISDNRQLNRILLLPLAFVGQAMFPFPVYDIHAHIFVLVAILLFVVLMKEDKKSLAKLFLLGVLLAAPVFFKQNVGVGLLIAFYGSLFAMALLDKSRMTIKNISIILAGTMLVFAIALFLLYKNDILAKAFHNLFSFPALHRNPLQSFYQIILNFFSAKFLVLYASFFLTIAVVNKKNKRKSLAVSGDSLNLALLVSFVGVPFFLLLGLVIKKLKASSVMNVFAIVSKVYRYYGGLWYLTFLIVCILLLYKIRSKGIKVLNHLDMLSVIIIFVAIFQLLAKSLLSVYAIWPLLLILIIYIRNELLAILKYDIFPQIKVFIYIVSFVSTFWLFTSNSAWYQDHLSFNFKPTSSITKGLNGLACEGNIIPIMDNMFMFVEKEIPFAEAVATIPGEDPFYFATGRKSVMSYLHLIDHTYDYDTDRVWNEMKSKQIIWIIIKLETQVKGYTDTSNLLTRIKNDYKLYAQIRGYDIYRRLSQ